LPDMQGNAPMQPGQGQGLSLRDLGVLSGVESITLLQSEIPVHSHVIRANSNEADNAAPTTALSLARSKGGFAYQSVTNANLVAMAPQALALAGGGLPHNNMQPYLTLNFCIALQGIFPQRP
jgi:microcystin-dependent protein